MVSPIFAAIGTLFAPAAAAAAAPAVAGVATAAVAPTFLSTVAGIFSGTAGGSLGATILGGAISGYGQAKMAEKEMEKREGYLRDRERRDTESYEGSADAMRFWGDGSTTAGVKPERIDARDNIDTQVGTNNIGAKPAGNRFRTQKDPAKRYQYDPETRRVQYRQEQ